MAQCSIEGCSNLVKARGLCRAHYLRVWRGGDPGGPIVDRQPGRRCSVPGCPNPYSCKGFCKYHYKNWWKNGDPGPVEPQRGKGPDTYVAAHARTTYVRGPAKGNLCLECGEPAADWSYRHGSPDEQIDEKGRRFSSDPSNYDPRCKRCHRRYDVRG